MVDFWTYSCINCQRTLPYLNAWYEKYKDQGFEIVGVHTPEFEFEKKYDNVKKAIDQFNIQYPVVQDNDYGTWRNYGNRYWPRKYLIDVDGFIVYDHIGEGKYEETELMIQTLLKERKEVLDKELELSDGTVKPEGAETSISKSPEIYFGFSRNEKLGNGQAGKYGKQNFTEPKKIEKNKLYLVGDWDVKEEYATNIGQAKIIFRYEASKVFSVARSEEGVIADILVDGEKVNSIKGTDVAVSQVKIDSERLYNFIEDHSGAGEHILEIKIPKPGLDIFTFTFG